MGLPLSRPSEPDDSWFNPELRSKAYDEFGDAYRDQKYVELTEKWNVEPRPDQSYLAYVKQASNHWIHLRLLADFMQIGTVPQRWKDLDPTDATTCAEKEEARTERVKKTKVCVLDYCTESVTPHPINSVEGVGGLKEKVEEAIDDNIKFRLYVVEDLSRDVIETLGHKLGIEPGFFRAHIVDYAWYNVLDRWRDPPSLDMVGKLQNWIQLRYVTARYFDKTEDTDEFKDAIHEAKEFNILRRPDNDLSNKAWWDKEGAIVGLTRSRATFWLQSGDSKRIGVLLLDPTVESGVPLWRGRRNWIPTPDPRCDPANWPTQLPPEPKMFYDDFLYWAQKPDAFSTPSSGPSSSVHVPMQALLHLICSEWLTMSDYIKTRLNQIDLEIVKPKKFAPDNHIDIALERLHMWRRLIPLYREMVSETLLQVFRFPCHTETFSSTAPKSNVIQDHLAAHANLHHGTFLDGYETPDHGPSAEDAQCTHATAEEAIQQPAPGDVPSCSSGDIGGQETRPNSDRTRSPETLQGASSPPIPKGSQKPRLGSIKAYQYDFVLALSYLEESQKRIDRLTSVVTAVMKIEDTRRSLSDARNIGRLTWLATFFIPFSLIATIFCMQPNLGDIYPHTVRVYFATSVPLAVVTVFIAWVLSHPLVQKRFHIAKSRARNAVSSS